MDSLNLSPIKDGNSNKDNNSVSPNSDLNSNQLPHSIEGTPYKSQESIKYQQNFTPSRELVEIQQKLSNSPGLDGLVRKCNILKVQSKAQAAVNSQFYQQNLEHSLDIRQQLLATNHLLPSNFHKVQDQEVQQIFGVFTTPCKDQPDEQQKQNIENNNQGEVQEKQPLRSSEYKERLSAAPIDLKLILSQKIISPNILQNQQQQKENNKDMNTTYEKQLNGLNEQYNNQNVINPLFAQSFKSSEFNYDSKFQRILQSSSPTDQYKQSQNYYQKAVFYQKFIQIQFKKSLLNTGSGLSQYQIGYSSLKQDIQQQQQSFKPKKDYKNNFQTYLSLIGLGSNRSNHHGSSLLNTGSNLYFATKPQSNNSAGLYRVSSTERQSGRNFSQIGNTSSNNNNSKTINNSNNNVISNNQGVGVGNKRRTGLEGIIDKINNKKDYLLQKKGSKGAQNPNSFSNQNNGAGSQTNALSSSNNANNLIKLSRILPNSHQSSKQAELEGSLEKIRLISMQRNINYQSNVSKENEQQQKSNPLFKSGFQSQQYQSQLIQPKQVNAATSTLRSNLASTQSNYFPSLGSSIGHNQRYSNLNQAQQPDRFQNANSAQVGLASTAQNFSKQQQILSQPISSIQPSNFNSNSNNVETEKYIVRNESQPRNESNKQQPQQDILQEQPKYSEQEQQVLNFDAFEDYEEKVNGNTQESDVANLDIVS